VCTRTAGAEKYKSITSSYYRKCQGGIIMFDLTDGESFRNLEGWFREVERFSTKHFCKMVIANKLDLVESGEKPRMVAEKEIIDFCLKHSVTYKCTSAVSGLNIHESFVDLVESTAPHYPEIYDEISALNPHGHEMQSQSWEGNPDLSLLPHDPSLNIKRAEGETVSCPSRCC
jgi:GTPase SAR1 family protein